MESKLLGKYVGVFKSGKMKGQPRWAIMVRTEDGTTPWIATRDEECGRSIVPLQEGDLVRFEYQQSGDFYNLTELVEKLEQPPIENLVPGSEPPEETEEIEDDPNKKIENRFYFCPKKNRLISRQSSLERAIQFLALTPESMLSKDAALELAEIFYQWVNEP